MRLSFVVEDTKAYIQRVEMLIFGAKIPKTYRDTNIITFIVVAKIQLRLFGGIFDHCVTAYCFYIRNFSKVSYSYVPI